MSPGERSTPLHPIATPLTLLFACSHPVLVCRAVLPRKRLELGWEDLAFGLNQCCSAVGSSAAHERQHEADIELWWRRNGKEAEIAGALVCLSVRSAFDLALSCLALPAGSEIVMSAVTIKHMVRCCSLLARTTLHDLAQPQTLFAHRCTL